MDTRPIGVFDSGLGGLTFVKEFERLLPREKIVYFGDTGRVPYGTKGRDTIIKYALQDIRFLKSFDVKAIVIACGTVSSVAFGEAAASADVPIISVVKPTAGAAARCTKTERIGVLGTSATIGSGAYKKAILELMPDAEIKSRACPLFVPLVENGYFRRDNQLARLAAHEYLDEFSGDVDTLIMGCTHYPLLRGVIQDILPGITLVDAGLETAKATVKMLEQNDLLSGKGGGTRYFVSDSTDDFARLASIFLEHPVADMVEKVEIEKY